MEVPAAGMGASGPDKATANPTALTANPPLPGRNLPVAADSVAALLGELSQSDLTAILRLIEGPAADGARVAELLRAAGDAAAGGNIGRLLDSIRQLANLDPVRAEALGVEPAFASYRTQVEHLLSQISAAAKLDAEGKLANATQLVETGSIRDKSAVEVSPEVSLLLASKFIEAGGLANYTRSSAISASLLDPFPWVPAPPETVAVARPAGVSLRWVAVGWFAIGAAGAAFCGWLRADYLPAVCIGWAAVLVVLMLARRAMGLTDLR